MAHNGSTAHTSNELGVGMIGYAFMGAAHSHAWRTDLPLQPRLTAICGRNLEAGKHVLCEKPLANTVAEAKAMTKAGSGALGDIGAHVLDMAQFVTGSAIRSVNGVTRTFVDSRPASAGSGEYGFTHQVVDLLTSIVDGVEPSPSFADGLAVQRVLSAIETSSADGATQHIGTA